MNVHEILASIDAEIIKLQQAREMISGSSTTPQKKRVGRPKGSKSTPSAKALKKRVMSDVTRQKIAAAQKKRWATSTQTQK